ncbi:hypothetical protein TIFTF001_029939 [Ficus carica]|uniref:Uncharacterized protein n=1 Tax=Ficus carica TaxID=3494 RepID=A0AA88DTB7_FICCA|nr:hypothetical protein TIFTF001_029939 [Ficus carica]
MLGAWKSRNRRRRLARRNQCGEVGDPVSMATMFAILPWVPDNKPRRGEARKPEKSLDRSVIHYLLLADNGNDESGSSSTARSSLH